MECRNITPQANLHKFHWHLKPSNDQPTTLDLGGNISCLRAFISSEGLSSSESVLLPLSCFEGKFASGSPCKIHQYHLKNKYVYQRISTLNLSGQRIIGIYVSKNNLPLVSTYFQRLLSFLFPLARKLSSHEKLLKPNLNPQPQASHIRVHIKLIKSYRLVHTLQAFYDKPIIFL